MTANISRRHLFQISAVAAAGLQPAVSAWANVKDPDVQHPVRDIEMIRNFYAGYQDRVKAVRKAYGRPLTLSEKILFSHLYHPEDVRAFKRGEEYAMFKPDRLIMQDPLGLTALQQFLVAECPKAMLPSSLHCDHLIVGSKGADIDLATALKQNAVTYKFLRDCSDKLGIDFWEPGSGIIHQQVLENYAFPGMLMVGTDSHTPNGSALSGMAIAIGGADAVDCMSGAEWELLVPRVIGVELTGKLQGWARPKDVILKLLGMLSVKGGTNAIIEYFGPGLATLSTTGKGTIANMGAELGATSSVYPLDENAIGYLTKTGRAELIPMANKVAADLMADPEVLREPEKYYDQVIRIDLSKLEPQVSGPFSPDASMDLSTVKSQIAKKSLSEKIEAVLIGSCTNSSYEDMTQAAALADQAYQAGLKLQCPTYLAPGSNLIKATMDRDGLTEKFTRLGITVLANACGPCCGMWAREDNPKRKNTIVTSFNRNFRKRNDQNPLTEAFLVSPDLALTYAFAGSLAFNVQKDALKDKNGKDFRFTPVEGSALPAAGYARAETGCHEATFRTKEIVVDPTFEGLKPMKPFPAWNGKDFVELPLLIKVEGKCTTDHITPAGKWVKLYGNLEKLSENTLSVAKNAFGKELDRVWNQRTHAYDQVWKVAADYKAHGTGSIVVGDDNYGEGSSREQAALQPRFLNVQVVIAKSFARIHETNLKKQGVLALTFANPADYARIREKDRLSVLGLTTLTPGKNLEVICRHEDGTEERFEARHTYNANQIEWFKYGSALNMLRESRRKA